MKTVLSAINLVMKIAKKIQEDNVGVYAAQAAFFILIAFFPTTMLFLTLLNYLPFSAEQARSFTVNFLSPSVSGFVDSLISEIFQKASGAVLSVTTVTALWSASRGLFSVITGLNAVYGAHENRGYVKLRLITVIYMLVFMITLIITLVIIVFGGTIANWLIETFPELENATSLFTWVRWLFGFCLLVLFFLALYTFAPKHKTGLVAEFPGAVISAAGWLGFSAIYSFYINNFANYSYLYGSLTAIVLLMLWLYICMNILFFGAEINVILKNESVKASLKRLKTKIKGDNK